MTAVLLSLIGLFISAYLYLYKIGKIGSLACGTGGCETVQWSPWSRMAGIEVSLVGLLGYAVLLAISLASLQATFA
ncbi:MAG TPA: vitamin K epoxide reductase family protein, partial [Gemmatimonadales bacterium]|nr:vitamin K epoxide reductase family protein [Gemmatimonadales bacterium]